METRSAVPEPWRNRVAVWRVSEGFTDWFGSADRNGFNGRANSKDRFNAETGESLSQAATELSDRRLR